MNALSPQVYEFYDFRLDADKRLLWRGDVPVPLTPRVFETLLFMVEHRDTVLDKERLMEAVWPDSIVEENNLTQNISALRRVFGETPGSHRFIVTVPGRGYRFVADVRAYDQVAEPPQETQPDDAMRPSGTANFQLPTERATATKPRLVAIALAVLLFCAFILAAGVFAFRIRGNPSSSPIALLSDAPLPEKSIAVLPFDNLSSDAENAYFVAGVQDEILSNLAKVADLKVISRTSANLYKSGSPRNAREIGQQLGVARLLEGSVQRSGGHLRVHAQLIDTRTDSHLWAQTYDSDLADVFAIQSEIAQTIADQLKARISENEKAAIAQPATGDLVADDLYRQALALELRLPQPQNLLKAVGLLEQAVAHDPRFFLAYCALARMHLIFPNMGYDHAVDHLELAEAAIQKAAQLQPDSGEVHLVRGRHLAMGVRDYDRARTELELARHTLPNDPVVYYEIARLDRRQGRWTDAARNLDRAVELDPRNGEFLIEAANTYQAMRRYAEAAQLGRRAAAISPHDYYARLLGATLTLDERADIRPLRTELNAILAEEPDAAPEIAGNLLSCAILERDAAAADRALAAFPPGETGLGPGLAGPRDWYVGYVARLFNRPEVARPAFETTRTILEKRVSERPDNASAWSLLGLVEAALGRKEEAVAAGRRACDVVPLSKEALSGLKALRDLAKIYAWVGEKELALQYLEESVEQAPVIGYGELKLDPDWDPLRGDPRFEKIVASLAPKAGSP